MALFTRRDFLKSTASVAAGMAFGLPTLADELLSSEIARTRVVLVRNPDAVLGPGRFDSQLLQQMLDDAVCAYFRVETPVEGWRKIFKPEDVVGIKTNHHRYLPTPTAVEKAIVRRILETGVAKKNLSVDDQEVRANPVFQSATALINVRPMRVHDWAVVGGMIKNYIVFVPNMPDYHPNSCSNLGAIWHLPVVKDKTRLNIQVMLTPHFHAVSTHYIDPKYIWNYCGILVSADPVALDSLALRIIQLKRQDHYGDDRSLNPTAPHVIAADKKFGLGTSDLNRIEIIRLGWMEESFI